MAAFGLPVNGAEIVVFGKTKALVIERFDRKRTEDGRWLRVPQEDACQALSCPPSQSLDSRQIERKQMKLAMSVGDSRHYKIEDIKGRHFIQTAERAGLPGSLAGDALEGVAKAADGAMNMIEEQLPSDFPEKIHISVKAALSSRLRKI